MIKLLGSKFTSKVSCCNYLNWKCNSGLQDFGDFGEVVIFLFSVSQYFFDIKEKLKTILRNNVPCLVQKGGFFK